MQLTPSIESKYRKLQIKYNWSEVELILVKEFLTNLAVIHVEAMKREKKVNKAA